MGVAPAVKPCEKRRITQDLENAAQGKRRDFIVVRRARAGAGAGLVETTDQGARVRYTRL